jgi:hypothetical protein
VSEDSDRDLSAAFEELRAPSSTANYATRSPGFDVPSSARSRNWPQALAGVLAVAVALAGAGTFLALRSARQGGAPSSSSANPAARSGAAMAYDSTAAVTVMYGGTDGSGKPLTDTWTWDGTAWTAAPKGPGPLVDVRMVDDPATGGVLMVGMPAPKVTQGSGGGVVGCVTGGSGTASPGSVSTGGTPAATSGASNLHILPTSGTLHVPSTPVGTPVPTCPPVTATPIEQTWLFTSRGWNRAAAGSPATTPVAGAQLTFDPTTRQVVAVSSSYFACGPPLESASNGAAIACPVIGASTKPGAATVAPAPCEAGGGCLGNGGSIATWSWSGGPWKKEAAATLQANGITLLFNDPATGHATLMTQVALGSNECPPTASCLAPRPATLPATTTWSWTGSGWRQVSQVHSGQQVPSVAGAAVAAGGGHILVLTSTGVTWTFAAGQWTQNTVAGHPGTRTGAAMAEGPSGTVVLFGGTANFGFVEPLSGISSSSIGSNGSAGSAGSDTWVWNGTEWKHVAGTAPSLPPTPTVCPDVVSLQPRCVGPPTKVLPATPLGVPHGAGGTPIP